MSRPLIFVVLLMVSAGIYWWIAQEETAQAPIDGPPQGEASAGGHGGPMLRGREPTQAEPMPEAPLPEAPQPVAPAPFGVPEAPAVDAPRGRRLAVRVVGPNGEAVEGARVWVLTAFQVGEMVDDPTVPSIAPVAGGEIDRQRTDAEGRIVLRVLRPRQAAALLVDDIPQAGREGTHLRAKRVPIHAASWNGMEVQLESVTVLKVRTETPCGDAWPYAQIVWRLAGSRRLRFAQTDAQGRGALPGLGDEIEVQIRPVLASARLGSARAGEWATHRVGEGSITVEMPEEHPIRVRIEGLSSAKVPSGRLTCAFEVGIVFHAQTIDRDPALITLPPLGTTLPVRVSVDARGWQGSLSGLRPRAEPYVLVLEKGQDLRVRMQGLPSGKIGMASLVGRVGETRRMIQVNDDAEHRLTNMPRGSLEVGATCIIEGTVFSGYVSYAADNRPEIVEVPMRAGPRTLSVRVTPPPTRTGQGELRCRFQAPLCGFFASNIRTQAKQVVAKGARPDPIDLDIHFWLPGIVWVEWHQEDGVVFMGQVSVDAEDARADVTLAPPFAIGR